MAGVFEFLVSFIQGSLDGFRHFKEYYNLVKVIELYNEVSRNNSLL